MHESGSDIDAKSQHIFKGNKSLMYKDNMQSRLCKSGKDETQEHLEKCDFTKEIKKNLNLGKRDEKIVLITRALKDLYTPKTSVDKNKSTKNEYNLTKGEIENRLNPEGASHALPVPSEETSFNSIY